MFNKRAVFWNTASQILVRLVTLAFTLVSIKLLANYLGPAGVGQFNAITYYVNFFLVIADLGLFAVTVREISKDPANERKILSNAFVIRLVSALVLSLVASLIVFVTPYRHDPNMFFGVMIACGFLFFNLLASIYDVVLQYRLKMQYSALAEFLSKLITIAALALIIYFRGSFLLVVSTVALSGLLIFFFKWLFASRYLKFGPEYDKKMVGWIIQMAIPLGLVFIVNNLFIHLDSLMLFVMKGAHTSGIYSSAYKILDVTAFFAAYYASALKPTISENIDSDKGHVTNVIEKSVSIMLLMALPITIIGLAFSKEIILFIANAAFLPGAPALMVLVASLPILYLDVLLSEILVARDERKLLIRIAIFILAFNFILNLIFIPIYSLMAAAWITLISELVLFAIYLYYTKKILPYRLSPAEILKIVAIAVLSLIFAIFVKAVPVHFIIQIAIVIGFYALAAYVFGIVKIRTVNQMLRASETMDDRQ